MGDENKIKNQAVHELAKWPYRGAETGKSGETGLRAESPDIENPERFYRLLEGLQRFFFHVREPNGEFTFLCSRITNLLGYAPEDFQANWKKYLADNLDNADGVRRFKAGLQDKPSASYEVEFFHSDGHRLWLEIFESAVLDANGKAVTVEGVSSDITKRKQLEEKMHFSERRFREMSESSPIGIFQIDPDDHYIFINTRWQTIVGRPLTEVLGTLWWEVIHPEDQEEVFRDWAQAEEEDREFLTECRIQRPDKVIRWVRLRSTFFFHDQGKITYGTIEDVTTRKEWEDKLARYADELKRSNQALDDFAGIASHDLKEPLRKIVAFADRIKKNYSNVLDARGQDYLERMQKATVRMSAFINDLLEFSKITTKAKPFEPTKLEDLVSEVLSDLEARIAETGGGVEVGKLPTLDADPLQMRQLFQNLIGNALKFHKKEEKPRVKVSSSEQSEQGFWEITVEDNGVGFDEKYLERIFKPFERLHGRSEYEGSGMGLAICQKIVNRHGGRITAKSAPQKGTTFIITLPEKQQQ